jgi:DNA helicase HerA-like ATPase
MDAQNTPAEGPQGSPATESQANGAGASPHTAGDGLGTGGAEFTPKEVPSAVRVRFDATAEELGGAYMPSPESVGAVGHTHFDGPSAVDGSVNVLIEKKNLDHIPSQAMVRIKSLDDHGNLQRTYLGAVVAGPFWDPDGIPVNSPLLEQNTVQGSRLLARYHGRASVHLVGEESNGQLVPPRFRPRPNSPVHVLDRDDTAKALNLTGNLRLGLVVGHEDLPACVPTTEKGVLPRHTGVLGTTGGGKSQTVSGMVKRLQEAGVATIVVDVEGEYTEIDQPAAQPKLLQALELRGMAPEPTKNVTVYHLVGRETSREAAGGNVQEFGLSFDELSPHTVADLLEYNEAQRDRFFIAYEVTERVLRDLQIYPATEEERKEVLTLDQFDRGYPRMTLSHLIDIAGAIRDAVSANDEETKFFNAAFKTAQAKAKIKAHIDKVRGRTDSKSSWRAVLNALWRIHKLQVFDRVGGAIKPLEYEALIQGGRVSILDLSDTDSSVMNNLVIASLLRGVQKAQDEAVKKAQELKVKPTPVMVVIEEAHEFLSAERIKEMPSVFQQVARIAKRGRKRWLGLTFVTQLPQHLPDEVLGLLNNWVLHKITDANVIARLKRSITGLDSAQWNAVPGLAQGQALVSFTSMTRPLLVSIDPSPSHVRMTD